MRLELGIVNVGIEPLPIPNRPIRLPVVVDQRAIDQQRDGIVLVEIGADVLGPRKAFEDAKAPRIGKQRALSSPQEDMGTS
jgi:hypothetical protein